MQRSAGGILTPISSLDLNALGNLPAAKGVDAEQSALENGLTLVLKNIEFRLLDSDGATSAILEAHRSLAGDTSLREHLLAGVSAGLSCAEAIVTSANHFCEEFARSSSSYLQERALDVRDVCFQLLQQIYGEQRFPAPGKLTQPAICMADELTPSQFLELDKNHLKGLLLKSGGTTSHTVILARSFNIPTLVGVDIDALTPWQHQTIYIDGNAGAIVVEPGEAVARYYQQEARVQDALREQQRVWLTNKPVPLTVSALKLPLTSLTPWKRRPHSAMVRKALVCSALKCSIWIAPVHRAKASCTTFFVRRWSLPTDAALLCALWTLAATNPLII